jgi:hypothetical protein
MKAARPGGDEDDIRDAGVLYRDALAHAEDKRGQHEKMGDQGDPDPEGRPRARVLPNGLGRRRYPASRRQERVQ